MVAQIQNTTVGALLDVIRQRLANNLHLATGAPCRRRRRRNTAKYHFQSIQRIEITWPELSGMDVSQVTEQDLADWQARFAVRYAPDTANGALMVMKAVFFTAKRKKLIEDDPAELLRRMEIIEKPWVLPTEEQWQQVVVALRERVERRDDYRRHPLLARHQTLLVLWLAATGMRPGASTALLIGDVDTERFTVRLDGQFAKNRKDALLPVGCEAIEVAKQAAKDRPKSERLFICVSARYALNLATKIAGVPINHRTLRKLFATRALEAGVTPAVAAKLLTHSDGGATLLKHYARLRDDALRAAVSRMDEAKLAKAQA